MQWLAGAVPERALRLHVGQFLRRQWSGGLGELCVGEGLVFYVGNHSAEDRAGRVADAAHRLRLAAVVPPRPPCVIGAEQARLAGIGTVRAAHAEMLPRCYLSQPVRFRKASRSGVIGSIWRGYSGRWNMTPHTWQATNSVT